MLTVILNTVHDHREQYNTIYYKEMGVYYEGK